MVSTVFLEQLSALGNIGFSFPEREPKITKAGHKVIEPRKPANPVYVFEWLMATLQQLPSETAHSNLEHRVLFKRVRLESIRAKEVDQPWTRSSAWVAFKSALHVAMIQVYGFKTGGCRYYFNWLYQMRYFNYCFEFVILYFIYFCFNMHREFGMF